jgi:hypothetical protein
MKRPPSDLGLMLNRSRRLRRRRCDQQVAPSYLVRLAYGDSGASECEAMAAVVRGQRLAEILT